MRWYGTCIDIHDRKEAEAAIAASERNLAQIIDTIPAYVWSARSDGGTDFLNRHCLDYLGVQREQPQDWAWSSVVHPEDLRGMSGSGKNPGFRLRWRVRQARVRRFDGEYRPGTCSAPIRSRTAPATSNGSP